MSFSFNNILNIPERSILDKRLTKAFFLKNFDLSVTEIITNITAVKTTSVAADSITYYLPHLQ